MKLLLMLLLSNSVFAATLECNVLINLDSVIVLNVVTSLQTKNLLSREPQISSYVTEVLPDFFTIEAYIPSLDSRIYNEGFMRTNGDVLVASVWTRDVLTEIKCKKIK